MKAVAFCCAFWLTASGIHVVTHLVRGTNHEWCFAIDSLLMCGSFAGLVVACLAVLERREK